MKRIRAGIVGVGKIGRAQIEAIRKIDYAEVAAIVVRDGDKAKAIARDLGIPRCYTDYRDLLDDPDIDVVHNCTPNLAHFQINKDAVLAGKAILSEKPLTVDSQESAELVELTRSHNVFSSVNFVYRHHSILQRLRGMIEGGALGKIYAIRGAYLQDWLSREADYDWRVEARLGGPSRAMADIGSHWCDLAQFLLGQDITEVCADLATFIPVRVDLSRGTGAGRRVEVDTEDYGSALLLFSNGARGSFTVSQVSAGRKTGLSLEIDGSRASARWDRRQADRLLIGRRDSPTEELILDVDARPGEDLPTLRPESQQDLQKNMIDSFFRSILFGETPRYADFGEGNKIVKVVEAILKSDITGGWEKISE